VFGLVGDLFDTGINLVAGTTYNVTASGTWNYGTSTTVDANGDPGLFIGADSLIPNERVGRLIYKVGLNGTWAAGGTLFTVTGDGRLYLGMNDRNTVAGYTDNTGSILVEIC
jgi:hypothetical protein